MVRLKKEKTEKKKKLSCPDSERRKKELIKEI